jgi:hypothetical protein
MIDEAQQMAHNHFSNSETAAMAYLRQSGQEADRRQ